MCVIDEEFWVLSVGHLAGYTRGLMSNSVATIKEEPASISMGKPERRPKKMLVDSVACAADFYNGMLAGYTNSKLLKMFLYWRYCGVVVILCRARDNIMKMMNRGHELQRLV